jgi:hypothetical protein
MSPQASKQDSITEPWSNKTIGKIEGWEMKVKYAKVSRFMGFNSPEILRNRASKDVIERKNSPSITFEKRSKCKLLNDEGLSSLKVNKLHLFSNLL